MGGGRAGARSGGRGGSSRGGATRTRNTGGGMGGGGMAGGMGRGMGGDEGMGNGGAGEDEGERPGSRSRGGSSRASPGAEGKDATSLLKQDHQRVKRLFEQFERARDSSQRLELFQSLRNELQVHATLEEEIFYPDVERQRQPDLEEQVREAHQEHDEAKQLLARGEGLAGDSDELEAVVTSLREAVEHHVQEEEGEMFPRAREVFSAAELKQIGARLMARKKDLVEQGIREMAEV
jgi:iron-sulfur cluster repair protein YtfE (RIC family)